MFIPFNANPPYVPAKLSQGHRSLLSIRLMVIHDTESPDHGGSNDAITVAHYFQTPAAGGSAHIVGDDVAAIRCLQVFDIPEAAPPCNTDGLHYEICGYASWSHEEWLQHRLSIERAAYWFAKWSLAFGIPPTFLTADELKRPEATGYTTHAQISKAFGETTHTDPGPNFPLGIFDTLLHGYRASRRRH